MLGADPYNFDMLGQRLNSSGVDTMVIPQTMMSLSPAMKEFEVMLKTGFMKHENNPVARWCFGNVRIAIDGNENIKPMKNKSIDRIDTTVAWINAVATMLNCGEADMSGHILSDDWGL
jgi:phage terminase large subunit-like protein